MTSIRAPVCRMTISGLISLIISLWSATGVAQQIELRMVTKPAAPFVVMNEQGEAGGIAMELWRLIEQDLGLATSSRTLDLRGILDAVRNNQADIAIAPLTVTAEREARMDFTQPYFRSGLAIAVPAEPDDHWTGVIQSFFSLAFLKVIASLLLLLLVIGMLIWLAERRRNPEQFGGPAHKGIGSGFWWSAVTMTTVGYGDRYPVTASGRLIAVVWMFAGIILISSFTAAISASLTVSRISSRVQSVNDLFGARIATLSNSAAAEALHARGMRFRALDQLDTALNQLNQGTFDALIYDQALLEYHLRQGQYGKLRLLPDVFAEQHYAFALPQGSPHREAINLALLRAIESPAWEQILQRWLGR